MHNAMLAATMLRLAIYFYHAHITIETSNIDFKEWVGTQKFA
jgi:hypothetical protein